MSSERSMRCRAEAIGESYSHPFVRTVARLVAPSDAEPSVGFVTTNHHKMALADVVLGIEPGVDVKPRAQAPMIQLRRPTVGRHRAGVADQIFVGGWRDSRHLLALPRRQREGDLGARALNRELTHVPGPRRA